MNLFHLFPLAILSLFTTAKQSTGHASIHSHYAVVKKYDITTPPDDDDELIPWAPYKKLTWDDYLCAPVTGTDAVASTSTSLGLTYQISDNEFTFHIICGFSKTKSWGLLKTDYILAHEQGHFDITEIFARKLNEVLQHYRPNNRMFKTDINRIYQQIVKEKEDTQELYDSETDHSRNHKVQYEWLEHIHKMLDESAPYAAYP